LKGSQRELIIKMPKQLTFCGLRRLRQLWLMVLRWWLLNPLSFILEINLKQSNENLILQVFASHAVAQSNRH